MTARIPLILMVLAMLIGCHRNGQDEWQDIDYSKIARENYRRENDRAYIPPPSVLGCVDDDLYNCRPTRY